MALLLALDCYISSLEEKKRFIYVSVQGYVKFLQTTSDLFHRIFMLLRGQKDCPPIVKLFTVYCVTSTNAASELASFERSPSQVAEGGTVQIGNYKLFFSDY